jgi:hypothetical protein
MKKHVVFALLAGRRFDIARAAALDLHTTPRLLLDVLDICTAMANDLRPQVEAGNRLKTNGDALFGPFPSPILIALHTLLLLVSATETALVDELGEFLFHHLLDLRDSFVQTFLRGAGYVQIQRRVSWRCHAFVGIVASTGGDILRKESSQSRFYIKQWRFKARRTSTSLFFYLNQAAEVSR